MAEKYEALGANRTGEERWTYAPGQLDLLDAAKAQAKKEGLWNFFLPNAQTGEGLSTWTTPTSPPSWARCRWPANA